MKRIMTVMVFILSICLWNAAFADDVTKQSSSVTTTNSDVQNDGSSTQTTTSSTTSTTSTIDTDAKIVSDIYEKYVRVPALLGTALTVTCENGAVTIDGTVTMQVQADEAIRVAKEVEGVNSVTSSISVTTNPTEDKSATPTNY